MHDKAGSKRQGGTPTTTTTKFTVDVGGQIRRTGESQSSQNRQNDRLLSVCSSAPGNISGENRMRKETGENPTIEHTRVFLIYCDIRYLQSKLTENGQDQESDKDLLREFKQDPGGALMLQKTRE